MNHVARRRRQATRRRARRPQRGRTGDAWFAGRNAGVRAATGSTSLRAAGGADHSGGRFQCERRHCATARGSPRRSFRRNPDRTIGTACDLGRPGPLAALHAVVYGPAGVARAARGGHPWREVGTRVSAKLVPANDACLFRHSCCRSGAALVPAIAPRLEARTPQRRRGSGGHRVAATSESAIFSSLRPCSPYSWGP